MNLKHARTAAGIAAIAALAFPAAGIAKGPHGQGQKGHHHAAPHGNADKHHGGKTQKQHGKHTRALIVAGVVSSVGLDGSVQVDVKHANHHGSGLVGQTVTFDVSQARIVVRDVNGDGARDLSDVAVGDRVRLHARVAKGETLDPTATIVARRMIDKGQKKATADGASPTDGSTENSGTDTSGTDTSGSDTSGADTSGADNSGSDSSTPPANG